MGRRSARLLARALGGSVESAEVERWAAQSLAEEEKLAPPGPEPTGPPLRHIGEFELLSELGHGNMGKVYRSWQPSLGRQVALKVLSRADDPKAKARFHREIHALGRVDHPNLVKIFTSGFDEEPCFFTMELVEGATLDAVCETAPQSQFQRCGGGPGRLARVIEQGLRAVAEGGEGVERFEIAGPQSGPPVVLRQSPPPSAQPPADQSYVRQIVKLMRQVALAAHALHEAGVVHRDIKPGNIMVTVDGSQGVLMDLGLAHLADEAEGRLTRTRQFVGTLRYASPEQVLAAGTIDHRSDIYSLGATLWELLTLRPIYGSTEQTPTPELMRRITSDEPERIRKYNPRIASDLEAIVYKCLEKDPNRRYSTAGELSEDLARWQRGEPVTAHPPTLRYVWGDTSAAVSSPGDLGGRRGRAAGHGHLGPIDSQHSDRPGEGQGRRATCAGPTKLRACSRRRGSDVDRGRGSRAGGCSPDGAGPKTLAGQAQGFYLAFLEEKRRTGACAARRGGRTAGWERSRRSSGSIPPRSGPIGRLSNCSRSKRQNTPRGWTPGRTCALLFRPRYSAQEGQSVPGSRDLLPRGAQPARASGRRVSR